MKDILIISNYFPPEIGAASNRISQLAKSLSKDYNVTVICPLPNYPTGKVFKNYNRKETLNNVTVNRLWLYPSKSKNKFVRLFSILSFSLSIVWYFLWHRIPKTVIVNSPPLFVAYASLLFLSRKKHQLILNVSDLWPKSALELNAVKKGFGYNLLLKIERYNYRKADLISGQSEEILSHIKTIVTEKETILFRNYPDFEPPKIETKNTSTLGKIRIVYAGLLGVAQDIVSLAKNLDYSNIEFHIYGSGAEEESLRAFIESNLKLPIIFHGSVSRAVLHHELLKYDATIIPLKNRIYGAVPSKIFEYSRLGLPIIYFGGGEGERIVKQNGLGWVAEAGNYNALNAVISKLKLSDFNSDSKREIQKTAIDNFNASVQLKALKELI
ncbi:glycosyltransferase involved in cell wall biosynthesis [Winogradskyella wandonensis]|uniref:Glycosyltransferase involved in cell wall biosynthesis n=1 Tax=Winogradskyella wandonensis TaxID=1442586 RepID=A0A4V6NEN0_9FLAO|nr:glycosyltransferase family 4 protein [Winogradskyella wandonensis]TCK67791.1 glycosyltransferase involved in cell wall biosynthesis [Winogradskyella wandonensis]